MVDEEFISEYKLTLSELVTNAKITINVLSMLADENKKSAQQIADTIEERIRTAIPVQKLPSLYLVDSIIKNVKESDYLKIFTKNIVSLFICVFERGDEKIRSSMYKLRQTWVNLFPNEVLLKLDLAVSSIDPAWPITAVRPVIDPAWPITAVRPVIGQQTVHINPDFFDKAKEALKGVTTMTNSLKIAQPSEASKLDIDGKDGWTLDGPEGCQVGKFVSSGLGTTTAMGSEPEMLLQKQLMAKQLLAKQQELLQIQQRRVEIELAKAQMQIEEARQQASKKLNQSKTLPVVDADGDKSPKKLKAKRNAAQSNEDVEGMKNIKTALQEPTSPLKKKSPIKATELTKAKTNLQTPHLPAQKSANAKLNELPEKIVGRKRKSGDIQKVDPRLRKKMMVNKGGIINAISPTKASPEKNLRCNEAGTKAQGSKTRTSRELSEDLKDLFGNEDKDFRMCVSTVPTNTSYSDAHWKVLKSEGQNVQAHNFAQQKVAVAEHRTVGNNRIGLLNKNFGLQAGRKALLPTPPVFGQDLKQKKSAINTFEKLQEMKKELDVEAERLNSLACDVSKNGDFEAFEADVMRGNALLNKARWNNWKNQERGAKRMRRQHMGNEQFQQNGPSFGNRLLHAPPRTDFPNVQQHRPSPPHPQFPHQPSPPQFNQPHSPGQNNFGYGHDNNYMEDDYNFNNYGGDGGHMNNMEPHYRDENNPSSGEPSWSYRARNPHNAMVRPANPGNWPRPQQTFSQPPSNFNPPPPRNSHPPNFQNNFNSQNNNNQNMPAPGSQASDQQYVNQLFSKLTQFGILNSVRSNNVKAEVPNLSEFDVKKMKIKHKSLVREMNAGTLCRTCGLTFPVINGMDKKKGEEQAKQRYLQHLDWHFQINKKVNSVSKSERCREYYPDQDAWYHSEVVNITKLPTEDASDHDANKNENVGFVSKSPKSSAVDERLEAKKEKFKDDLLTFVYKSTVTEGDRCLVCTEGFESYWDDEKEEWGLRDAYKLKEKLFHASCFVDYDELEMSTTEQIQSDHAEPPVVKEEDERLASSESKVRSDDIATLSDDNKNSDLKLGVDNKNVIEKLCDEFVA